MVPLASGSSTEPVPVCTLTLRWDFVLCSPAQLYAMALC